MGRCQCEKLARAIERLERSVGIIPIRRVQRILRVVLISRVERVVRVVPIRWVNGITEIIAVRRVEGIVWCVSLGWVQRVVRRILTGRIEDIVVALVLLREAWLGECRCDGEVQRKKDDDNPMTRLASSTEPAGLAYSPAGD